MKINKKKTTYVKAEMNVVELDILRCGGGEARTGEKNISQYLDVSAIGNNARLRRRVKPWFILAKSNDVGRTLLGTEIFISSSNGGRWLP